MLSIFAWHSSINFEALKSTVFLTFVISLGGLVLVLVGSTALEQAVHEVVVPVDSS